MKLMVNPNSITRKILPHHKQKTNKRDDILQLKKITGKNKQNSSIGFDQLPDRNSEKLPTL